MPTPDYSKSCIYMLRHKDDTELENIYIGSTTNFRLRKNSHKMCCCNPNNKKYNYKKYQYIRANGGWEEWKMIWLEDYPCKTLRELQLREDEVMLQYQNRINKNRASRTHKEWYEDNKERIAEYNKEYYEDNKDIINEKAKQYRKINKEQIAEYNKEYYEINKEQILEKTNEYKKINKEKIAEKAKEKIKCNICGCESTRNHLKRHQRTKKCQSHLTNS